MFDYLVNHALKNVWCTPDQDNQLIVKPARITPIGGVWNNYKFGWTNITLPEPNVKFHIYQLGQISPGFLNLFSSDFRWVSLAEACIAGTTICDIYVTSGVQLPRTQTYYYVTKEKALMIAVKVNPKINFSFDNDAVFLRVYDNAYFKSRRSDTLNDYVDVKGGLMASQADILALQSLFNQKATLSGGVYCFINGYKQANISLVNTKVGDIVEFVYDSSIIRTIDFKISTLATFDSTLDSKGKYLLHYLGADDQTIDYFDDIDLFMVDITTQKGVYVHKNAADTIRMLSHRDYSIPVAYVSAYFSNFLDAQGAYHIDNLYLRMHVRKSGYLRPLVNENHRIYDLYKLNSSDIPKAMIGVDATVPVWTADSLESSSYTAIMGASCCDITRDLVTQAYGYNAVSKLIGDTPVKVDLTDPLRTVEVPYSLRYNSTMFEYDAQGLLIDFYYHTSGNIYECHNLTAVYVEMICGQGTLTIDDRYGLTQADLSAATAYRYYTCPVANGVPTNVWTDVTGTNAYSVALEIVYWLANPTTTYNLTRSDKKFLAGKQLLTMSSGVLGFSLAHLQTRDGATTLRNMEVPMGELEVFLNGHSLIEGLDYILNFPRVNIFNKKYLINPDTQAQNIVYRFTGFCDALLKTTPKNEFGYIQQGRVSVNHRYDIHKEKVQRLVVGGRLRTADEVIFSEDTGAQALSSSNNGQPYLIRDIVVPTSGVVSLDTYTYRAQSLIIDQQVSDYLTLKLPQLEPALVNPILNRYVIYSPFICTIIQALIAGAIDNTILQGQYNDDNVRALCAPYTYLIIEDPIHVDNPLNSDYVVVHPHFSTSTINLDLPRYKFLNRVVRIYGNGKVDLSSFITLI